MSKADLELHDTELDALFAEAQQATPEPSPEFMARLTAEALAEQPQRRAAVKRGGFWSEIWAAIGGAPALAGLAVAGVAGLWLGIYPPAAVKEVIWGASVASDELSPYLSFDMALALEEM